MKTPVVLAVHDPVFKSGCLFVLGATPDELNRRLRRYGLEQEVSPAHAGSLFTYDREPWRVVWTRAVDLGVLAHELVHLVTRILDDRGIPTHPTYADLPQYHGDEPAAYLLEFYLVRVLQRVPPAKWKVKR